MEREKNIPLQRGDELRKYFDPRDVLGGNVSVSTQHLDLMVKEARKRLMYKRPKRIVNERGKFSFSGEAADAFQRVGYVIASLIANKDSLRLPETGPEMEALTQILVDSALTDGKVTCIFPVCPDYAADRLSIGNAISAEGKGGIEGAKAFISILKNAGYSPHAEILIADTEDDRIDILQRSAQNNATYYRRQCEGSVYAMRKEVADVPEIAVATFSQYLGVKFRELQYQFENTFRRHDVLREKIAKIGESRRTKHATILGREENEYELSFRYAAQYAALGELVRGKGNILIGNYPTPNKRFVNPQLIDSTLPVQQIISVLGTGVER